MHRLVPKVGGPPNHPPLPISALAHAGAPLRTPSGVDFRKASGSAGFLRRADLATEPRTMKTPSDPWSFRSRWRARAFGWRGSSLAIQRMKEAVAVVNDFG